MRKIKKIIALFLVNIIIALNIVGVNASTIDTDLSINKNITYEKLDFKSAETTISGEKPVFTNLVDSKFEKELNSKIDALYEKEIKSAEDGTLDIFFKPEIKIDENIVSILIYSTLTTGSSINFVSTINFNSETNKFVSINDLDKVGPNGVKLVNKYILSLMEESPNDFNTGFLTIVDTQDFYVEDGKLVILFDQFEIAPKSKGIVEISMNIKDIIPAYIDKASYYTKTKNGIKFVQLKQVADFYDYKLSWTPKTSEITIDRYKTGNFITSINIGTNLYYKGKSEKKPLEYAPEIHTDGRTYVPISFFDEILGLSYSVDSMGNIQFAEYNPTNE